MTLLRLDASIRLAGSASRELADTVEHEWLAAHPRDTVLRRNLGIDVLPADAWPLATAAGFMPAEARTDDHLAAQALAATLVDEVLAADALLIAVPLYNYGISQHLKAWIDLVIADPRAGAGSDPLLSGKPVVLAVVRGGAYGPGTPRDGWDHATDYLKRVLVDVWGAELTIVEREFTLVGVNPALDAFTDLAAELHTGAVNAARAAGRSLVVPAARAA